jgi:putative flippase GtrA
MIVLVPAYEPDSRLVELVADLHRADPELHVVVIDDGSGPAQRSLFDAVADLGASVVHHPQNRGKGAALKTGFTHVLANHPGQEVVCADSDGQHSVVDVLRVAAAVRAGGRHVLGARRFTGAVPTRSRVGNDATRILFRLATGVPLVDTQTGLRGYTPDVLPWLLTVPGDRFEYELNVLLRATRQGEPIEEIDIATIYLDGNASSHFRPLVDSARIYTPLLSFLASSALAFVLDALVLLAVFAATGSLVASAVTARLVSGSTNFAVNRRLVFGSAAAQPLRRAVVRYAALAGALLVANIALLTLLSATGLSLVTAKVLTEVLLVGISYGVQRCVVFVAPTTRVAHLLPQPRPATPGHGARPRQDAA